ncbi:MAG: hypothetical protein WKF77_27495, partial [Planctomycetaceae bacterium]
EECDIGPRKPTREPSATPLSGARQLAGTLRFRRLVSRAIVAADTYGDASSKSCACNSATAF